MVSGEKVNAESVQSIPLSLLRESMWNPRRRYLPEAMEELTQSIRAGGVRVPLLVRPVDGNAYEIGAGHRRFRAARAAELAEVPCIVRAMTDPQFLELLALENIQREDLTELEEAAGYRDLLDRAGYDVKKIAAAAGKNLAHIYARLKLLDLVDEPRQSLAEGKITAGHAILIARLQPKDQVAAVKEIQSWPEWRAPMSVRTLAEWIRREMWIDLARAPFPVLEANLAPAGPCTSCPKRTKAQPEIYPDAQAPDAPDECLDRECYKTKVEAHRRRALAEHPEAVKISTDYRSKRKDIYAHGEYELVAAAGPKDQAGGLKEAVFVDGPKTGQVVKVRLKPAPKPEKKAPAADAKERAAKEERRRKENQARQEARTAILAAIGPKIKGVLMRPDLALIAAAMTMQFGTADDERRFQKLNEKDLGREVVKLALGEFERITIYETQELPAVLIEVAKRYGVDAVAIEAKALAALDPKPQPQPATPMKVAAAKAKAKPAKKGGKK